MVKVGGWMDSVVGRSIERSRGSHSRGAHAWMDALIVRGRSHARLTLDAYARPLICPSHYIPQHNEPLSTRSRLRGPPPRPLDCPCCPCCYGGAADVAFRRTGAAAAAASAGGRCGERAGCWPTGAEAFVLGDKGPVGWGDGGFRLGLRVSRPVGSRRAHFEQ